MTTTRKSLLLGAGLAMAVAGAASASERTRDTMSTIPGSDGAVAERYTNVRMSGDGLAIATVNGQDVTVRADGSVLHDEVIELYGSVDRFLFENATANVPSTQNAYGTRLFADGSTGYYADLLGTDRPEPPAANVEELKQVRQWGERIVEGVSVIAFADGSVLYDPSVNFTVPAWVSHRDAVPNRLNENGVRVYADGAVFMEPAYQPGDTQ